MELNSRNARTTEKEEDTNGTPLVVQGLTSDPAKERAHGVKHISILRSRHLRQKVAFGGQRVKNIISSTCYYIFFSPLSLLLKSHSDLTKLSDVENGRRRK